MNERGDGDVADALLGRDGGSDFLSRRVAGLDEAQIGSGRAGRGGAKGRGSGSRPGSGGARGRRRRGRGEQLAELRSERLRSIGQGLAFLDLGDESAENVDRGQQDVGEGLDLVQGPASEGSEEVLHGMGQLRHAAVADRGRRTLERVRRSEDFVDHTGIDVVLELEQTLFDPFDLLEGLVREQTVVPRLQVEGQLHVTRPLAVRRGA
jgi:hypothetical protein